MKRVISAIIGCILIGIVIWFGIKSGSNNGYIVPFGLASAIIAPIGLSAFGYTIKRKDETLKKLAMIPEIDELIEKAETETEKIERLKKEKDLLLCYIEYESNRLAKMERKKALEEDAERILREYKNIVDEINDMGGNRIDIEEMSEELKELQMRIEPYLKHTQDEEIRKGNIILNLIGSYVAMGDLMTDALIEAIKRLIKAINNKKRK